MADLDRDAPVYPIGVVAKLTGLTARQIRYYEKNGLLAPARTPGNQRLYSPNQVDLLLEIKGLLAQGHTLRAVRSRLMARKERVAVGARPEEDAAGASEAIPRPELLSSEEHLRLIRALRAGRPLSSLYPVNNQAELVRKLQQHRSDDSS